MTVYFVTHSLETRDTQVITYSQPGSIGPPWGRGRYETLDYMITPNKWTNSITNWESDMNSNLVTDQFILNYSIQTKLRGVSNAEQIQSKVRYM